MFVVLLMFILASVVVGALIFKLISFVSTLQGELLEPIPVVLEDPSSVEKVSLPSVFAPPTKALSVVIPAYNEEDRLGPTLDELLGYLQQRRNRQGPHFTYEVIIVDDGSRDKTVRVAYDYVRKYGFDTVRVLRVPQNRGKGHAVKRGVLVARGEYVLFMDADGATRVGDLEKLEAALAKCMSRPKPGEVDGAAGTSAPLGAALGSRAHLEKAAMAKRSRLRNFLTWGFHLLVLAVAGGRVRDTQCGFKLFTRRAAGLLYGNQRLQRWCFDVELIHLAEVLGVPLTEVFVEWTEMPGSKIRATSILHMAFELLTIKVSYQLLGLWKVFTEAELNHKYA